MFVCGAWPGRTVSHRYDYHLLVQSLQSLRSGCNKAAVTRYWVLTPRTEENWLPSKEAEKETRRESERVSSMSGLSVDCEVLTLSVVTAPCLWRLRILSCRGPPHYWPPPARPQSARQPTTTSRPLHHRQVSCTGVTMGQHYKHKPSPDNYHL